MFWLLKRSDRALAIARFSSTGTTSRTAVVTGGSRGIGKSIATMLLETGFRVVVMSRTPLSTDGHAGLLHVPCDVSEALQVNRATDHLKTLLGSQLHVLVNCAGIARPRLLASAATDALEAEWRTNVLGAILVTKSLLKSLLRARDPHACIVNIGSVVGAEGGIGLSGYAASKGALVGLTRTWAKELADNGIRVNLLAPGPIATEMTGGEHEARRMARRTLLRRPGEPIEIAHAARFLIENQYVTGQVLRVDGGFGLRYENVSE